MGYPTEQGSFSKSEDNFYVDFSELIMIGCLGFLIALHSPVCPNNLPSLLELQVSRIFGHKQQIR